LATSAIIGNFCNYWQLLQLLATKVSGPNCFLKAQTSLGNLGFSTFFISMNIKKLYKSTYFNLNNFKIISPNLGQ
jgi:hypothetical protein